MLDFNAKLLKYKNFNLVKHINEVLPKFEKSVLTMERDSIIKSKKEVETEIFKSFILNSDSLLEILNTHEKVYSQVNDLQLISDYFNKINIGINYSEPKFIDKKKVQNFKRIIEKFNTDLSSFDTGERTLEYYDIFKNKVKYILFLCNDILIIGKINDNDSYSLINAFNLSVLKIKILKTELQIILSQTKFIFYGSEKKIQNFYDKFYYLCYFQENSIVTSKKESNFENDEMIEYALKTEKIEFLINLKVFDISNINFFDKQKFFKFIEILKTKKMILESNIFIVNFLNEKLKKKLQEINKIKTLVDLICNIFDFYYLYYDEEIKLIDEIEKIIVVDKIKIMLMIENQIYFCFKSFEKRIFSKRYNLKTLNDILNLIAEKLKFKGNDFSYLIDYFKIKIESQKEELLENAKREILKILEKYVNSEQSINFC